MQDHWAAGYRDATKTLAHPEILIKPKTAVEVYDFVTPPEERHMPARSPKKGE
jgi:NTE family protein